MWIELSRRVDNGHRLFISTKGVSRAGGYARAAGRMRPVLRVLLPTLPRALRCHVRALVRVHVYARAGVRLL